MRDPSEGTARHSGAGSVVKVAAGSMGLGRGVEAGAGSMGGGIGLGFRIVEVAFAGWLAVAN
jgi:hypothetical protein